MKKIGLLMVFVFLFSYDIKPVHKVPFNKAKAALGKKLFFDKRLSKHKDVSCNSCHNVQSYGMDNMKNSIGTGGVKDTPMNTPTVYNAVFNAAFFWNGRAGTLEQQAIDAFEDKKEHDMTLKEIVNVVNKDKCYVKEFKRLYNRAPNINDIANAIAEYEKSLVTLNCRFDQYLKGNKKAVNKKEKHGYELFKRYGCITCHNGVNVGGNSFQKIGIFMQYLKIPRGLDRYYVTGFEGDKYVYKVPSLRNVEKTYPYFHDGSVKTLKEAIKLMGKLNLGINIPDKDVEDIESFLKTLTGEIGK